MAMIANPDGDGRIEVELVDAESHGGSNVYQVEATSENIVLSDPSGESPWLDESEVNGS